jgi:prevent-host-death family protein
MQMLPISRVEDKLNKLIDSVVRTGEQVTITRHGLQQ